MKDAVGLRHKLLPYLLVIGLVTALTLIWRGGVPQASEVSPTLNVSFLNVGQGDGILLTTPNRKYILIDGGPDSSVLSQLGQTMPFYARTFDLVIATHNDADHITGINEVLPRYNVQKMWINGAIHTTNEYLELLENIKAKNIPTEVMWRGKTVTIDGVTIDVLHPQGDATGQRPNAQNDLSIVTRITFGEKKFLFTGDIDEGVEQELVKSGDDLKADVLKVPHHGSASGLALNFLNLVAPEVAVIQVGEDNRYGHPAASIIKKLEDKNIKIYRTDRDGRVTISTDGKNIIASE